MNGRCIRDYILVGVALMDNVRLRVSIGGLMNIWSLEYEKSVHELYFLMMVLMCVFCNTLFNESRLWSKAMLSGCRSWDSSIHLVVVYYLCTPLA